ncbi:hypothetical protein [Thermococcus peptonophilus]|nr:hypothetical protein [Thermococcus peptonophilus]
MRKPESKTPASSIGILLSLLPTMGISSETTLKENTALSKATGRVRIEA